MNERRWSASILWRYVLFQLPELALAAIVVILLRKFGLVREWVGWLIFAVWVLKDAILYPFVWRAYDWNRPPDAARMIGARGLTRDRLDPSGYIEIRGELWKAELMEGSPPVEKGRGVRVREVRGLTLAVEPDREPDERAKAPPYRPIR